MRLDMPDSPEAFEGAPAIPTERGAEDDDGSNDAAVRGSAEHALELSSPIRFTQTSPPSSPSARGARRRAAQGDRLANVFHVTQSSGVASDGGGALTSEAGALFSDDADAARRGDGGGDGDGLRRVIWGTDIDIDLVRDNFRQFLADFIDPSTSLRLYPQLLEQMAILQQTVLNVSCAYLKSFDATLYRQAVEYPSEVLALMDTVVYDELRVVHARVVGNGETPLPPHVQLFQLDEVAPMRALNPRNIDQLVAVRGMVIRASTVIPEMKQAFHRCAMCGQGVTTSIDRGVVNTPASCTSCRIANTMELIHNRCTFTDKQLVKLQETPDAIPDGDTPHTVQLVAYDKLVDVARPGDRVEVTGVFRAVPLRDTARQRSVKSIFKTYIDVVHYKKTDKRRLAGDVDDDLNEYAASKKEADALALEREQSKSRAAAGGGGGRFDDADGDADVDDLAAAAPDGLKDDRIEGDESRVVRESREAELRKLAERPDIVELLVRSLAPSIWQLDDVKKGILCLLFGGTNKDFSDQGFGRTRGDINILLCGDPGTSKSQLLSYVHKLAPRGIYTSGKGSSAVGLTAYITKDPDTGESVLESGALVLSDRGVCCIDEFDKMSDGTRAVLHEVMEQQTVSVAKAGIVCTLNARTSILASANPIESRYNPNRSVVENLDLPPTLLSRFDLIYLVLDKPNEATDRYLARHLVSLYWKEPPAQPDVLPVETMTRYISYARKHCHPLLSDEAAEALVRKYTQMRRLGASNRTVSATPRQLESLVRLSEALARMRLSSDVDVRDVNEASRLLSSAMQTAAIDPRTGRVDMDLIHTGRSAAQRTHMHELAAELKRFLSGRNVIRFQQLLVLMQQQSSIEVTADDLRDALRLLSDEEFLTMAGDPRNETIRMSGKPTNKQQHGNDDMVE
jgi:DNA replication licensing factor MCM4